MHWHSSSPICWWRHSVWHSGAEESLGEVLLLVHWGQEDTLSLQQTAAFAWSKVRPPRSLSSKRTSSFALISWIAYAGSWRWYKLQGAPGVFEPVFVHDCMKQWHQTYCLAKQEVPEVKIDPDDEEEQPDRAQPTGRVQVYCSEVLSRHGWKGMKWWMNIPASKTSQSNMVDVLIGKISACFPASWMIRLVQGVPKPS